MSPGTIEFYSTRLLSMAYTPGVSAWRCGSITNDFILEGPGFQHRS